MTPRRLLLLLVVAAATLVAYAFVLGATAFLACGISGCSGGGFGPAYGPTETQVGLVVAGLVLLPVVLLALRPYARRAAPPARASRRGELNPEWRSRARPARRAPAPSGRRTGARPLQR